MHIDTTPKLDFDSVLIRPKRSTLKSRGEVDLTRQFKFKWSPHPFNGIPLIAANMDTVGTIEMANVLNSHKVSVALHKHYDQATLIEQFNEPLSSQYLWYSMGIGESDIAKFNAVKSSIMELRANTIRNVCIDVANGYSQYFVDFVKRFREQNPSVVIMAGNVVTPEITEELILAGADIVKVGIGPGSVCTTRIKTGIGYPQLSAIIECADAAHGLEGQICGDGGCRTPGDVAKAFGGGADFVMLGGMFAGHDESGGKVVGGKYKTKTLFYNSKADGELTDAYTYLVRTPDHVECAVPATDIRRLQSGDQEVLAKMHKKYPNLIEVEGERHVEFYGMSSKVAQDKHNGGVAEYRASEGKRVLVPYRGPVENTLKEILGGVRSACTYTGARKLKELSKRTTFIMLHGDTHNQVFGNSIASS
jgi:GMP reductase